MKDNAESEFIKIESKPRKFFLKGLLSDEELEKIKEKEEATIERPKKTSYSERDLHPFLTYYAYVYMKVSTKTIYHERSKKREYAEWLHPDLVGVFIPQEADRSKKKKDVYDWNTNVLDFGRSVGDGAKLIHLYSFELKKELTFSNLRESFFQAVSNSSWANEGYLVAAKINGDRDFLFELGRLSSAFGIGIIMIDIDDPDSSEILFPAKFREDLDWITINKLARENPNFNEFIIRINKDFQTKEVRTGGYDKVYSKDDLEKSIKEARMM